VKRIVDVVPASPFVRYIFQPVEVGQPDDVFNPVQSPAEKPI
jgi:hypothetical protein